ncbi:MAG: tyrosine-protein phosphatase [Lentilactobacillus buchneri]|jgi:protein-tyrosine phosphatase|nr:tyrosine-protein phosphatase [Lentilactobacillus buchneri]
MMTINSVNQSQVYAKSRSIHGTPVQLHGTSNTFDLGGIKAKNGMTIKPNRLIRSDSLSKLTYKDKWRLDKQSHLRVVIDFRSTAEMHQMPDKELSYAIIHHLSVMADPRFGVHSPKQYAVQLAHRQPNNMQLFYKKMVTNRHSIKTYQKMFKLLLNNRSGAVLYHCTHGKDRTGIATMLILSSLGVPKKAIFQNYLQSNQALRSFNKIEQHQIKRITHNHRTLLNLKRSQIASRSYLRAAYSAIDHQSGSVKNYLKHKMKLSNSAISTLRKDYLTKHQP